MSYQIFIRGKDANDEALRFTVEQNGWRITGMTDNAVRERFGRYKDRPTDEAVAELMREYQGLSSFNSVGTQATIDTIAALRLRDRIRQAQQAGNGSIDVDFDSLRTEEQAAAEALVEGQRQATRSPDQVILEEVVTNEGMRPLVQRVIDRALEGGKSPEEAMVTLNNEIQDGSGFFRNITGDFNHQMQMASLRMAHEVLRRRHERDQAAAPAAPAAAPGAPAADAGRVNLPADFNTNGYARRELVSEPQRAASLAAEQAAFGAVRTANQPQTSANVIRAIVARHGGLQTDAEKTGNWDALYVVYRDFQLRAMRERGDTNFDAINTPDEVNRLRQQANAYREALNSGDAAAIRRTAPEANLPARDGSAAAPEAGADGPAAGGGNNGRARIYRYQGQLPPEGEIPTLAENQVRTLQQAMVDAGLTFTKGADGKYGPNTHNALKQFAASLQPSINIHDADFTANGGQGNEQAQAILQALQARAQERGGAEAPAAGAPAAPDAPAVSAEIQALRTQLGDVLTQASGQSADAINCLTIAREEATRQYGPLAAGATTEQLCNGIRADLETKLRTAGVNADVLGRIMQGISIDANGTLSGEPIRALEVALGFSNADNQLDGRDQAVLNNETSRRLVATAFNNGTVSIGRS